VVYNPFLTVRLIVDGPGMLILQEQCPQSGLAACDLSAMLTGHAERMDASKIMFASSADEGSLRLLSAETQRQIAREDTRFASAVVKSHPLAVGVAILGNMIEQVRTYSVIMTLPLGNTLDRVAEMSDAVPDILFTARLTELPAWLSSIEKLHSAVYALSALAIAVLIVLPAHGPARPLRIFALCCLAGILANALICGGISQPAERYGGRVMLLLPMVLVVLLASLRKPRKFPASG